MTNQPIDEEIPSEIDFTEATCGRHYIPAKSAVLLPASIKRSVWKYSSDKAERKANTSAKIFVVVAGGVEVCWEDAQGYDCEGEGFGAGLEVAAEGFFVV
jgi:hypothetical protein